MKVLIIEDNITDASGLKKLLEQKVTRVEVRLATNLENGLAEATGFHPDVVVLDAELPGSGAMETIASCPRFAPAAVVITTAHDEEALLVSAMEHGADDFLVKASGANVVQRLIISNLRRLYFNPKNRQHA